MSSGSVSVGSLFGRSLRQAGRHWPLAVALYLPSLILGLLTTLPAFVAADRLSTLGPWVERAAEGDWLAVVEELGSAGVAAALLGETVTPEVAAMGGAMLLVLTLLGLSVLLQGLAYSFLAGGVLSQLAEQGEPFWASCRRWFWPMVRFGIVAVILFTLLAGVGSAILAVAGGVGAAGATAGAVVYATWLGWVNGWLELGRADLVVRRDGEALAAVGRSLTLLRRPAALGRALLLWLFLAVLAALLTGLVAAAVLAVPAALVPLAFVGQQVGALVGSWVKLLRLSLAVQLATAPDPALARPATGEISAGQPA